MTIHMLLPIILTGDTVARNTAFDQVAAAMVQEPPASAVEEVHLSQASQLALAIDGAAEVRWEKIEGLRVRIASGTYRIASSEIAARMMDDVLR